MYYNNWRLVDLVTRNVGFAEEYEVYETILPGIEDKVIVENLIR